MLRSLTLLDQELYDRALVQQRKFDTGPGPQRFQRFGNDICITHLGQTLKYLA